MAGYNPIIPGFAPDPSVCLIKDTFFLVNSSFHVFPGLPIYASRDLKSWRHIGNAINRTAQISLVHATTELKGPSDDVLIATGGLYAPTIRHHDGVTYIFCTNVIHDGPGTEGSANFFIHTGDIWGGQWSDPVYYDFNGIDPSVLFDEDGRMYVQGTKTPDFQIHNFEIDVNTGKMLTEPKVIWEGWDKRWTEGPHLYKKDGWYYLLCAEGGTFEYHMVSMARSRNIWGPYESYIGNPITTAYGSDNYVQNTGHADLFQDLDGAWWAVMLGVRSKSGKYPMGRETFLAPVDWPRDGWPKLNAIEAPALEDPKYIPLSTDGIDWVYLRDPDLSKYDFTGRTSIIRGSQVGLDDSHKSPSFVSKRQRCLHGNSTVQLVSTLGIRRQSSQAGLAVYKDECRFISLGLNVGQNFVFLYGSNKAKKFSLRVEHTVKTEGPVFFRIGYSESRYDFAFRLSLSDGWTLLGTVDTSLMSGMDFTGPLIGMFLVGEGEARFRDFTIQ
ncbi:glycosyl hydrolase [Xylariales sp. PMI_506]|nr:glycosyl hydrolase [Xylariales sp. PMI_506]